MPIFGHGLTLDLIPLILVFPAMHILKRFGWSAMSSAGAALVYLGTLCLISRTVSFRYIVFYRGTVAIAIGGAYIVFGIYLFFRGRRGGDVKRRRPRGEGKE